MIAIIDYGMGNLRSVQKAFEKVGHAAEISDRPETIARADKVILPGVGAMGDAMRELCARGLDDAVKESIAAGRPFLGICLGLQLLFDKSYEGGEHAGLGIVPGEVRRFEVPAECKVPHMGWNQIELRSRPPILADIADGSYFYFVHSYYVAPRDRDIIAAEARYPEPFTAMIWRDNLYATQFHPEKSQADGLKLLKNFAEL
ncbi:MAG: imidazole glycerol phosphate synthase subunit HisH [Pirellulales bacterium]|nr:imidazole glycerol phosphate synthase subunit HisH [Pirellulales bacterium]